MKRIVSLLTEVLYYISIFAYLLVMKIKYSFPVANDNYVFFAFVLILFGLFFLSGSHINKYEGVVFSFIFSLYLVAQKIYMRGFGSYFRFSTAAGLAKEVSEVGGAIEELVHFEDYIPFIVLFVITVIFLVLHYTVQKKFKYKWFIRLICIPLIAFSVLLVSNMEKKIESTRDGYEDFVIYKTDYYLYDTVNSPTSFVEKFGLLTYAYRDASVFLSKNSISEEANEEINEYFNSVENSISENEYTGLFEGKSLLIVQAESLMNLGISEELTPTLYNFVNNGIEFKNYDTPLLVGSTSDTEFMTNTSFIPETEGYPVCYQYINNTYPVSLGNLFKEKGYYTYAFHNNYAEYYNRDITFDKYGYDFYDSYKLGLENLAEDSVLSEQIGWMNAEKEKFMSYWVSYSGHQPYTFEETGVSEENVQKIKELYPELNDEYVVYFAKQMDLDAALTHFFFDVMDWSERMDDVVIVVFGDHPAKGLDYSKNSNLNKVLGVNIEDNPEEFYTPCFIYANNIEHVEIDKYMTALDLLPTLSNLWGIDYNSKQVFGRDIFDSNYDGFCFDAEGNYFNTNFKYDVISGNIETYNGYSKELAEELVYDFNKKRDICNKILKIDYFGEKK